MHRSVDTGVLNVGIWSLPYCPGQHREGSAGIGAQRKRRYTTYLIPSLAAERLLQSAFREGLNMSARGLPAGQHLLHFASDLFAAGGPWS